MQIFLFKKIIVMKKLDVQGELALMNESSSEKMCVYLSSFQLDPKSQVRFLDWADMDLKRYYFQKYQLSLLGEAYLVQHADLDTANAYFEEWMLDKESQKLLLESRRLELIMAYIRQYDFVEKIEPLLFVPDLIEPARLYAHLYQLYPVSEIKMFELGEFDIVADYIDHDELHTDAEIMLLSDKYVALADKYAKKWGFGLQAQEIYARRCSL